MMILFPAGGLFRHGNPTNEHDLVLAETSSVIRDNNFYLYNNFYNNFCFLRAVFRHGNPADGHGLAARPPPPLSISLAPFSPIHP